MLEISLTKDANYRHFTASAYVGLCLCLRASENQPLKHAHATYSSIKQLPVQTVVYFHISDEINALWRASRALEKKIDPHTVIPEVITGQETPTVAKESGRETRGQKRALSPADQQLRISNKEEDI